MWFSYIAAGAGLSNIDKRSDPACLRIGDPAPLALASSLAEKNPAAGAFAGPGASTRIAQLNRRVRKRKVQPWSSEGTPSARFKVTGSRFNDPSPP
jgi:hypothetical protein